MKVLIKAGGNVNQARLHLCCILFILNDWVDVDSMDFDVAGTAFSASEKGASSLVPCLYVGNFPLLYFLGSK